MWNLTGFSIQNDSNFTNTTMEMEYNFEVFVLLPIMLFGITGNILVCMAVSMEKRLQSVTNYFLLSLAITDLLVSVIVMPFSMIHQFFGKYWHRHAEKTVLFLVFLSLTHCRLNELPHTNILSLTHCRLNELPYTNILEDSNFDFRYVRQCDLDIP